MTLVSNEIFETSSTAKTKSIKFSRNTPILNNSSFNNSSFIELIHVNQLTNPAYSLKYPLKVNVDIEDDGLIFSNHYLNIHSFGHNFSQALDEFENCLVDIYNSYKNTPDDELTRGGILLKYRLLDYIQDSCL